MMALQNRVQAARIISCVAGLQLTEEDQEEREEEEDEGDGEEEEEEKGEGISLPRC